ncbi:SIMPL domain-containing protein [Sphingomonas sp. CFBP 13720]|uniref:SIMPL domain-containing protein n=1 Tax=Sphingomonas sp. CFBP 13720 TaxID=2775302 RepID=UPI00177F8F2E|nr:SIMPL domain-containing protein [Sphingomonas sp. CFBP 13720]MBD8678299.1 SIMPL domain-containing protein [Sphingomonas sp. CFBP 13720]
MLRPVLMLAATIAALPAAAQTVAPVGTPILTDATLLDVTAQGKATRVPDIATIRAGVVTQSPTAAAALSDNAARMTRVVAALRRAGVAERDLQTSQIQLQPQYRYAENQPPAITGYQASNTVSVRFRDVAKSGAILDALVTQGANQIDGPTLSVDAADAAMDEARTDAIRRARARAELYAKAAGLRVDRILTIAEGSDQLPQPPMPMMARMMEKSADSTPVAAGEQELGVTVSVRFLLR